jgi:hypothetical protein
MNHQPSDDSPHVPPSGQAVVAGVSLAATANTAAHLQENRESAYYLNSSLKQALGCLDIKLTDELNRFRSKQEDRSPDMQVAQVNEVSWEEQSVDFDADAEILTAEIVQPSIFRNTAPENRDMSRFSETENGPTSGFIIIDGLMTTAGSSRNAITTVNYAQISVQEQDAATIHENLALNFSRGGEIAPFHDEYLSSSQELLRQIQAGYPNAGDAFTNPTQSAVSTPKRKYLTPLKIGSMVAACAIAGGAVYTYVNPSILAPLMATKVVAPATTNSSLGQLIQSPNLAANEFTDLSLSNINTIKLPPTATAANVSTTTTSTIGGTTTTAVTAPAAIPFNSINSQVTPPSTITAQPRLADSLVKSLLPPNFQAISKPIRYRAIQPGLSR